MKTDYLAHDARYRELRAQGADGWEPAQLDRAREAELAWLFASVTATRVLELGCGAGNLAASLVARGCEVTGIDISPAAIAWATERGIPNTRFVVGDVISAIPGTYDLVIDGHCLHCIIGEDRARLLANVRTALAPGGSFFVATMCGAITNPELRACFDPVSRCQIVGGIARRYIGDPDDILAELRTAGFTIAASTICARTDELDQDHLWAITSGS